MRITLAQVADEKLLKLVWKKEVRPVLRSMTFRNLNLAPDPLHYAGYEWGLETLVSALAKDLRSGHYSPERGEIVRMAKGKGLSRPLCFLATRDALVYRAITWLARDQLLAEARTWVGYKRSDKGGGEAPDHGAADSFDWFRFWLDRQGLILQMVDDPYVNYFIESDIANFFPSIRLEAIREHLLSETNLEKEVVRLCVQLIDGVMPRQDYSEVSLMGLPQEQIGASREIAHSLLLHVDKEFDKEGAKDRYTRFMDDILVGVNTPREGEVCISRLQLSLEALGLYPNAAKTVVAPVERYLLDSMVETNAGIDRLNSTLEKHRKGTPSEISAPPEVLSEIEELSRQHRSISERPKRWGRVTQRFYTLHRQIGLSIWWEYWREDIHHDPGAAPAILEYVRSWPLSRETARFLADLSSSYSEMYPNIAILAAETIASCPVSDDEAIWEGIHNVCRSELQRIINHKGGLAAERIAAAWLVAAWKFANPYQCQILLTDIPKDSSAVSALRIQALPLLVAAGQSLSEWVAAKPGLAWENALAAEYLRSLQDGEYRAVGVALSLFDPALRLAPMRFTILPRAVPLIEIVGRKATDRLGKAAPKILKKLQSNPSRLRDHKVERLIRNWSP